MKAYWATVADERLNPAETSFSWISSLDSYTWAALRLATTLKGEAKVVYMSDSHGKMIAVCGDEFSRWVLKHPQIDFYIGQVKPDYRNVSLPGYQSEVQTGSEVHVN